MKKGIFLDKTQKPQEVGIFIMQIKKYLCSVNDKWRKFLKIFLPVLFIIYLGGIITFTHIHIENGVTVVHSHPFKDANHKHTGSELQFLHQISTILLTGSIAPLFVFGVIAPVIYTRTCLPANFLYRLSLKGTYLLRAPPYFA